METKTVTSLKKPPFGGLRLILVTDDLRTVDPLDMVRTLPWGSTVIARSKSLGRLEELVTRLHPFCARNGIPLLAATDLKTATVLGVDGVHLSEQAVRFARLSSGSWRKRWIVTASAHSVTAVRRARALGVDRILISPVFPTKSHPGAQTLGPMGYRRLAQHAPEQACPLGGVTPKTLRRLKGAPVAAIAGTGLFLDGAEAW